MSAARIVVFAGKGGAGTTTVAAATALAVAQRGGRSIVASLGAPGSLARVLGLDGARGLRRLQVQGGGEAWACDAGDVTTDDRTGLADSLRSLLAVFGLAGLRPAEAMALPGFHAALALHRIADLALAGDHDLVAIDAGPMAEGLRTLGWLDLLAAAERERRNDERRAETATVSDDADAPAGRRAGDAFAAGEPAGDHGADDDAQGGLAWLAAALADPARGSGRLVMTGEPTALEAGLATAARLSLLGIRLEAVIVNRLFVPSVTAGYLGAWAGTQSRVLAQARERFGDTPIWPCWLQPEEVVGVPALLRLAEDLYAGRDPGAFATGPSEVAAAAESRPRDGAALPEWRLPYVAPDDISAARREDGVAVVAHGFRRVVSATPGAGAPVRRVRLDGDLLRFE